MNHRFSFFLILLLLIIAILTTLMIFTSGNVVLQESQPQNPHAIMTQINIIKFDLFGKPHHQLTARRLTHYLKNQQTDITKIHYIFQSKDEAPWHIFANRAIAFHGIDTITLYGNVIIQQLPGKNSRQVTILTEEMVFYTDRSLAETHHPVTIKRPSGIICGTGLQANLKSGHIKIYHTQGEYIPPSKDHRS